MKKELNYFMIGDSYGSNQDWFSNFIMKVGGCAAVTVCDSCLYFAREFGISGLYPFDPSHPTREDYVMFGMQMKPYLKPRMGGVSKLSMYEDGFLSYINGRNERIIPQGFSGRRTYEAAVDFVCAQIDKDIPIPFLLLKHRDPEFKNFVWHWFLLTGYDRRESDCLVKAATYGRATMLSLRRLWDTGEPEVGGMIEFIIDGTTGPVD